MITPKTEMDSFGMVITLRLPFKIAEKIDVLAKEENVGRATIIKEIIELMLNDDVGYCESQARKAAQEMHYWRSKIEDRKINPLLFGRIKVLIREAEEEVDSEILDQVKNHLQENPALIKKIKTREDIIRLSELVIITEKKKLHGETNQ